MKCSAGNGGKTRLYGKSLYE